MGFPIDEYFIFMRANLTFSKIKKSKPILWLYWTSLEQELIYLNKLTNINWNIWEIFDTLIMIDSKLIILRFYLREDDFFLTEKEIIDLIENDWCTLNKELCGYTLDEDTHESILFFRQYLIRNSQT